MLDELNSDGLLNGMPDGLLFSALGGKLKGISRTALEEAYAEYRKAMRRERARDKIRKWRDGAMGIESVTQEVTEQVTKEVTGEVTKTVTQEVTPVPSPLSPSPSPPLSPFPPTPPIPPIIPRNPVPQSPHPQKKSSITLQVTRAGGARDMPDANDLGIDGAWKHGTRARGAAAQRITDQISAEGCDSGAVRDLYDVVYRGLELGISPDEILQRARTQTGAQFASGIMSMERVPD